MSFDIANEESALLTLVGCKQFEGWRLAVHCPHQYLMPAPIQFRLKPVHSVEGPAQRNSFSQGRFSL